MLATQRINHKKKIFLSRSLAPDSFLKKRLIQRQYRIYDRSLIRFSAVQIDKIPSSDWCFFSSKKGVQFFFSQLNDEQNQRLLKEVKMAAIGPGTAKSIQQYGFPLAFTGSGKNTEQTALDFGKIAKNQKVLFPIAKNSLRKVQTLLKHQIKQAEIIVYNNEEIDDFILEEECDIYIFTSPMNVRAFFRHNNIPSLNTKVIAIGQTTKEALSVFYPRNCTLPYRSTELDLGDVCF